MANGLAILTQFSGPEGVAVAILFGVFPIGALAASVWLLRPVKRAPVLKLMLAAQLLLWGVMVVPRNPIVRAMEIELVIWALFALFSMSLVNLVCAIRLRIE